MRAAADTMGPSASGTSSKSGASANHGTDEITAFARTSRPPRTRTPVARLFSRVTRARALVQMVPPRVSMKPRAGPAYSASSEAAGNAIDAACGSGPNISASTRRNVGAAASCGGWFRAASASGSQSISRSRRVWPFRTSQFSTVSSGEQAIRPERPRSLFCSVLTGPPSRSTERRSFHASASHSITPPSRCHGAGSGGHESTD